MFSCIGPRHATFYGDDSKTERNDQQPRLFIGQYTDPLKIRNIEIWFAANRLSATIHQIFSDGIKTREGYPLVGLPREIEQEADTKKLRRFFRLTHLLPENGIDGQCNRVSVSISGKGGGGGQAVIPFQPGLALGSIVKIDFLEEIEEYANQVSEIQQIEDQIKSAENQIQLLVAKIKVRDDEITRKITKIRPTPSQPGDKQVTISNDNNAHQTLLASHVAENSSDTLISLWNRQIKGWTNYIENKAEQLNQMQQKNLPMLGSFQQGMVSPVDMKLSTMQNQVRGFESQSFSSEYISMQESISSIHDKISQTSSALSGSAGLNYGIWGAGTNYSHTDALSRRLADIKKSGKAEGVLVINARVTTAFVRCFSALHYDKRKLRILYDIMSKKSDDLGAEQKAALTAELKRYGISTLADGTRAIYVLTEAVLGGYFTAIATFFDEDRMDRKINDEQNEKSNTTGTQISGGWGLLGGTVGLSYTGGNSSKSEIDTVNSIAQTRVKIEIISEGVLTNFDRHSIEKEIIKHIDLNPAKFEMTKKDEDEIANAIKAKGDAAQIAQVKQRIKMESAGVAVINTIRGLMSQKEAQNIHTLDSAMEAFQDFNHKITSNENCGVPVGFYYELLTQEAIKNLLEETKADI